MIKYPFRIFLGLILIIINNILGHYYPLISIFITPVLLFILVSFVNRPLYSFGFSGAVLYGYGLILVNDLLLRFLAGGTHDQIGKLIIFYFFVITLALSLFSMLFYALKLPSKEGNFSSQQKFQNSILVLVTGVATTLIYFIWQMNI